jgi:hypothetical protein
MLKVGIIGGGGQLAEGIAAWLGSRNLSVVHYRPPYIPTLGVPRRPKRPQARLGLYQVNVEKMSQIEAREEKHRWVEIDELKKVDVLIYCLPSYLAEPTGVLLSSVLNGKYFINLSDRFMGTEALLKSAQMVSPKSSVKGAIAFNSPPALSYQRKRNGPTSIIYTKPFVVAAPLYNLKREAGEALLDSVFGITSIKWVDNSLELAFENVNSILHAVQDLECMIQGRFSQPGFLYSPQTYTLPMVDRINAVVKERDLIAYKLTGKKYRNLLEFDSSTFYTPPPSPPPATPEYRHHHPLLSTVPRPEVFTAHGYEDIGWSLVPIEACGKLFNIPTPAISSLINDWNSFSKVNYRFGGRSIDFLGISKIFQREFI